MVCQDIKANILVPKSKFFSINSGPVKSILNNFNKISNAAIKRAAGIINPNANFWSNNLGNSENIS